MSMPEYEEVVEETPEEPKKVKKISRVIKPDSPEPREIVTLRSHKRENQPKDEMVICCTSLRKYNSILQKYTKTQYALIVTYFRRN